MVSEAEKNLVVGIDVGGTGTKIGIVDANGNILARDESIATPKYTDFNEFVDAMNAVVQRLVSEVGAEGRIRGISRPARLVRDVAGVLPGLRRMVLQRKEQHAGQAHPLQPFGDET